MKEASERQASISTGPATIISGCLADDTNSLKLNHHEQDILTTEKNTLELEGVDATFQFISSVKPNRMSSSSQNFAGDTLSSVLLSNDATMMESSPSIFGKQNEVKNRIMMSPERMSLPS